MSISDRLVKYAFGLSSTITVSAMQEGLPVVEHVQPDRVTDNTTKPAAVNADPGAYSSLWDIGGIYYSAEYTIPFHVSIVAKLLEAFFEDTTIGGSPGYSRNYFMSHVRAVPSQYISVWKATRKPSSSLIDIHLGGLMIGWTMEGSQGGLVRFRPRILFADEKLDQTYPVTSYWNIDKTGNFTPLRFLDCTYFGFQVGAGSLVTGALKDFSITAQGQGIPSFWDLQHPVRWTRETPELTGSFTLRDVGEEVKQLSDAMKAGSDVMLIWLFGSTVTIVIYAKIHAGKGEELAPTRYGTFYFTGVKVLGASAPLDMTLVPGRA